MVMLNFNAKLAGELIGDKLHDDDFVSPYDSAVVFIERCQLKRTILLNFSAGIELVLKAEKLNVAKLGARAIFEQNSPFNGVSCRAIVAATAQEYTRQQRADREN